MTGSASPVGPLPRRWTVLTHGAPLATTIVLVVLTLLAATAVALIAPAGDTDELGFAVSAAAVLVTALILVPTLILTMSATGLAARALRAQYPTEVVTTIEYVRPLARASGSFAQATVGIPFALTGWLVLTDESALFWVRKDRSLLCAFVVLRSRIIGATVTEITSSVTRGSTAPPIGVVLRALDDAGTEHSLPVLPFADRFGGPAYLLRERDRRTTAIRDWALMRGAGRLNA